MRSVVFLVALLVSSGALDLSRYTPTPFGYVLSHCIHHIPSGAQSTVLPDGNTEVLAPNGTRIMIAKCDTQDGVYPVRIPREQGNRVEATSLPPDYDGWLQYTAVNVSKLGLSGGFDAFTNVMSVPDKPAEPAQVLYFFPGLQNIDWIPKVDPEPGIFKPFDIIQPVLQYPGEGLDWELKSWYVTLHAGALYSTPIKVEAGDAILCNMTRTGPQSWDVIGTVQSDPSKTTKQKATNSRLALQPWAYNTLECYGCEGCGTFPTKPITFTNNQLYQGGKLVPVGGDQWEINPSPAKHLECHEATKVEVNGDTTISFN